MFMEEAYNSGEDALEDSQAVGPIKSLHQRCVQEGGPLQDFMYHKSCEQLSVRPLPCSCLLEHQQKKSKIVPPPFNHTSSQPYHFTPQSFSLDLQPLFLECLPVHPNAKGCQMTGQTVGEKNQRTDV